MNNPTPPIDYQAAITSSRRTERPLVASPAGKGGAFADLPEARREAGARFKAVQSAGLLLIVVVVLLVFLASSVGVRVPGMAAAPEEKTVQAAPPLNVHLVEGEPNTLLVPEKVRAVLGILKGGKEHVEVVTAPTEARPLVLYGSTALDPTRLTRIRARFAPAEVVQIGQTRVPSVESKSGRTEFRDLRPGDRVHKGDVLGVFFSVDVGSKKNDLLDALVQLELDQKILDRVEANRQAVPEVFYLSQVRAVQGDRNAINRALNNLKVWNIPQEEIDALHQEAKKISNDKSEWHKTPEGRWVKGEKLAPAVGTDPDSDDNNPWGRVTLRAPDDGVIVERNVSLHEMVVDNTISLFQIARVDRLLVVANVPEDELPKLLELKDVKRRWTVRTLTGSKGQEIQGSIDEISYLIDVNQHNAVVKGYIDNSDGKLRAGQFITASVNIDPPKDVVEVPLSAIADEGRQCLVFVQTDPAKHHYRLRRVIVTHRFEKTAYVKSVLTEAESKVTKEELEDGVLPPQPLEKGTRVLTMGVLELKKELDDQQSRAAEKKQTGTQ